MPGIVMDGLLLLRRSREKSLTKKARRWMQSSDICIPGVKAKGNASQAVLS